MVLLWMVPLLERLAWIKVIVEEPSKLLLQLLVEAQVQCQTQVLKLQVMPSNYFRVRLVL